VSLETVINNSLFLYGFGSFLIAASLGYLVWYFYREHRGVLALRKRGRLPPYLRGIADEKGRIVISALASIWKEKTEREKLKVSDVEEVYSEGVAKGYHDTLIQVAREHFEPKILPGDKEETGETKDPVDRVFESLPPQVLIEFLIPSLLEIKIPELDRLTPDQKERVYRRVAERLLSEAGRVVELKKEYGEKVYKEEVRREASGETQSRILTEKKERVVKHVSVSEDEGNVPGDIAHFFVSEFDISLDVVKSLRLNEPDLMVIENRAEFLALPDNRELIRFLVDLHLNGLLPYFFGKKYEIGKVLKDFVLFLASLKTENLLERGSSRPVLDYLKERAEKYYSYKMARPAAYGNAKNGKWGINALREVNFLPLAAGYLAQLERPNLVTEFVDVVIEKLNLKIQDMFFREFTFTDSKTGEVFVESKYYDHLGFSHDGSIYIVPTAVDLWLGYYSLAMPYVLLSVLKVGFVFERPVYIYPYTIHYKSGKKKTFRLFEITDDSEFNKTLSERLVNKSVAIKDFIDVDFVEKITIDT